ncbi:hypothetical protein KHQ06_01695 [Nocardia tengchongensis]|uniref:Addiction module protein n=1 Tax=Nocardia tengchongensis TaxID=2055889 RepID=A0ABX8CPQ9_9NOCA|nr:hypothetical protein [Nocardia tengchongensis]QVI21902.1 hypothetical protein KHQ06_01695 [Nocardia tengchongensis]
MPISPEEMEQIAREVLGPTMRDEIEDPEIRARADRNTERLREMDAKGRRPATEDQIKIWQAWGESEIARINREQGENT